MKNLSRLIAITSLGIVFAACSVAPSMATHSSAKLKKHINITSSTTKWPQICPVSGSKIATAADASGSEVYKGKTYYFCCPMCKPAFDKDPAKYVAAASKHKYLMPM